MAWRVSVVAAALLAAGAVRAQSAQPQQQAQDAQQQAQQAGQQAGAAAQGAAQAPSAQSPSAAQTAAADAQALAGRCEALIRGELAGDTALQSQCATLVRTAANGGVEPGVGRQGPSAGQSVGAAFTSAGRELFGQGQKLPMGMRSAGPSKNLLLTNPLGWFTGLGVNASYSRAFDGLDKVSWVGQARYSSTDSSTGTATTFGVGAGLDWFFYGRNNEGLRIGPRLSGAFGTEDVGTGGTTSFGRLGLSGELGYNFIASNGLAASVAGGVGGRIAGDEQNEDFANFTGGEFGPYLQLGIGYGW
jgi:hypothetical protein